jgi:predicted O-linked N-acetylglucosamine transferase (SPINDLY family)
MTAEIPVQAEAAFQRAFERLARIRQRLVADRLTTPLFDSRRFTQTLEAAYQRIYERYQADLPPEDLPAQGAH